MTVEQIARVKNLVSAQDILTLVEACEQMYSSMRHHLNTCEQFRDERKENV